MPHGSTGSAVEAPVLIADDDDLTRELLKFRLERDGFDVVEARDGEAALGLALERRPRLAVLDVMMPKLDGYELTRQIRASEALGHTRVILLTARVREADIARGFAVGADDYLKKPFSPDELRTRVRVALARS
jgi:DNA-binding response OmpR family regulator